MNPQRGVLIAGNWKMNHDLRETEQFFFGLKELAEKELNRKTIRSLFETNKLRTCIFPAALSLSQSLVHAQELPFPLSIGCQNAHWEKKGAFTGEISGPMLQEIGIQWALVGHSERRQLFGETDATVRKKAQSLLEQGFAIILCIGETKEEREAGQTQTVLSRQLTEGLPQIPTLLNEPVNGPMSEPIWDRLILAYEPVWAIGTGVTATPEQAEESHSFIRNELIRLQGETVGKAALILYGGSVTPQNFDALLACPNVDGALAGGTSLKVDSYVKLIQACIKSLHQPTLP